MSLLMHISSILMMTCRWKSIKDDEKARVTSLTRCGQKAEGPRAHPGQRTMAKAKDRANGFSLAKHKEKEEDKKREMRKRGLAKGSE